MIDPVRVSYRHGNGPTFETTVERQYAEDNAETYTILPDESVWEHGRLRGPSRKGGRPLKEPLELRTAIPRPAVEAQPWNPADHNLDGDNGVLAYLADADPAERERVIALEAEGRNRKTVLTFQAPDDDPADSPDAIPGDPATPAPSGDQAGETKE